LRGRRGQRISASGPKIRLAEHRRKSIPDMMMQGSLVGAGFSVDDEEGLEMRDEAWEVSTLLDANK
jgi:hypothetical protein